MKSLSKMTLVGIVLVTLSPLLGFAGTIWSIYGSFDAMERSEAAGIGSVGSNIQLALVFSVGGMLGAIVGVSLIVSGMRNARKG